MKGRIIILICLCIAGSVYTQGACTNPFLTWLNTKQSGIVLDARIAAGPWTICNDVWTTGTEATTGTCCNANKLKDYFQSTVDTTKNSWGKYMSTLHRLRNNIRKISNLKSKMTQKDLSDLATSNSDGGKFLTEAQITMILDSAKNFEGDLTMFKSDAKKCFRTLHKFRSSVYCYGCWSHLSANTFTANSDPPSFVYKDQKCNALVVDCGSTWNFLQKSNLLMIIASLAIKQKKNNGIGPSNSQDLYINPAKSLNMVNTAFSNCAPTTWTVKDSCTQENLDTICTASFSWAGIDKSAREIKEEENHKLVSEDGSRRLLQSSGGGVSTNGATGGDFSTGEIAANTDLNTDNAGANPSFGKIMSVTVASLLFLLTLLN